jgi:hypothetical protein
VHGTAHALFTQTLSVPPFELHSAGSHFASQPASVSSPPTQPVPVDVVVVVVVLAVDVGVLSSEHAPVETANAAKSEVNAKPTRNSSRATRLREREFDEACMVSSKALSLKRASAPALDGSAGRNV